MTTYGSLFSGIGGLDLAIEEVFGATPAFHCEVDKNASSVLATHWPEVPNLGDITEVDWTEVPRVDILCGGFPCQDISSAGARAGIKEGTRSGLWFRYADAIRILRPRLVVVENVGALLVRGLDIVLGSLAEIGYDARWTCLRASDIGAPHQRNRLFLIAFPTDPPGEGREPRRAAGEAVPQPGEVERSGRLRGCPGEGDASPDPSEPERRAEEQQGLGTPAGPAPEPGERPSPPADPDGRRLQERTELYGDAKQDPTNGHPCREHPDGHLGATTDGGGGQDAPDPDDFVLPDLGGGMEGETTGRERPEPEDGGGSQNRDRGGTQWGPYGPAIARWEAVLGRRAPGPVDERNRLSPRFVEWMMGLPDGWVSDILPRNPALKACGNGVVTQQAVEALHRLMGIEASLNPSGESITVTLDPNSNP